jgi:hypothetical protein
MKRSIEVPIASRTGQANIFSAAVLKITIRWFWSTVIIASMADATILSSWHSLSRSFSESAFAQ